MSYSPFALHDERSPEPAFPPEKFERLKAASSGSSTLQEKVPGYLLDFANRNDWTCVQLDDVIQNKLQRNVENLYIDETLLKAHDPNLIFERVRQTLRASGFLLSGLLRPRI
jgi:hypothetical protein